MTSLPCPEKCRCSSFSPCSFAFKSNTGPCLPPEKGKGQSKSPLFGRAARRQCSQMALNGEAVVFPEAAWSWGCLSRPGIGAGRSPPQRKPQSTAPCNQTKLSLQAPKAGPVGALTCAVFPKAFSSLPKFNVHHPCGNHVQVTKSRRKSTSEEHITHSDRHMPWLWGLLLPVTPPAHTSEKPASRAERRRVKTTSTTHGWQPQKRLSNV